MAAGEEEVRQCTMAEGYSECRVQNAAAYSTDFPSILENPYWIFFKILLHLAWTTKLMWRQYLWGALDKAAVLFSLLSTPETLESHASLCFAYMWKTSFNHTAFDVCWFSLWLVYTICMYMSVLKLKGIQKRQGFPLKTTVYYECTILTSWLEFFGGLGQVYKNNFFSWHCNRDFVRTWTWKPGKRQRQQLVEKEMGWRGYSCSTEPSFGMERSTGEPVDLCG